MLELRVASWLSALIPPFLPLTTTMNSDEMFNWPDADVILRATYDNDSRDFRVHKLFLSFASSVFKDMFKLSQPSSPISEIDIIDVVDPPRALEVILHFIYPCADTPPIDDLTLLSEVLVLTDKYDIKVAQSRLRPFLAGFAKTEPLRVYAIACRLGLEEEMKTSASNMTSTQILDLAEIPEEFRFISATEYHQLLHEKYRKEAETVAPTHSPAQRLARRNGLFAELKALNEAAILGHAIRSGGP